MTSKYHAGELAIQAHIGGQESAQRVSASCSTPQFSQPHRSF